MQRLLIGCLWGVLWLTIFCGCAVVGEGARALTADPAAAAVDSSTNPYYLFTEAQLRLKQGNLDQAIALMQQALANDSESVYLKRELAGLWLMKQKTESGIEILEAILAEHPDDVETLILFGRVQQNLDDQEAAIDAFERVITLDPFHEGIYLQLGRMYMDREAWESAQAVFQALVDYYPGSYAGFFYLGRISAILNDPQTARAHFEKTLLLQPELVEPRFELGTLYESENRYEQAVAIYTDILLRDPGNTQAMMALGHAYHQQGLDTQAHNLLLLLGNSSLDDPAIIRTLVRQYLEPRDYEAAGIIIQGMIQGAPDSSDLNYLAGVALDGTGDKQAAIDHLRRVMPDSRFFRNATVHLAMLYQESEQMAAAVASILQAIEIEPDNPEFRLYLGSFYEQMEAYAEAEAALKAGLELNPQHARLYFRLGVVYDKWKRKDDCIAAMQRVIELEPDNANALNYLGYTYAEMGINLDEAEALIRRALEHKPGDGYIIDSLAWVFYQRGDYHEALPLLQQAVELVPGDPIITEHLGDVYNKLGMFEKARQSYLRAIENGHTDVAAIEEKLRLLEP